MIDEILTDALLQAQVLERFDKAGRKPGRPKKGLVSLREHDAARTEQFEALIGLDDPTPNGIECPQCQTELLDTNPLDVIPSVPPRRHIHCPKCGFHWMRVA